MDPPVLARLGAWVAELDYDSIPDRSLAAARLQVLSQIAAAHAGARSGHADCVLDSLTALSTGAGRATSLGTATSHAPQDAAFANAALTMVHDFDDIIWMGHASHSAVFAALAAAEHEGGSARQFLTAVVAANEVAGRVGASCLFGPLNGQMWTFIHLVGAAAAVAKILQLDAERTTHALAIALAQPNFALQPGFLLPTSKLLAAAVPTATGLRAGYLAQAGMTGEPTLLEARRGFWSRFAYVPLTQMMAGLGEPWVIQTLTVKTFPGCHYFQTACTAIERLVARGQPLTERPLRAVRIDTTKLAIEASRFAGEYARPQRSLTAVNVNFDIALTAALHLTAGRLSPAELCGSYLAQHATQVRALRELITVRHDPELTLRALECMAAVPAGGQALRSLGPRDLWQLWQRYRDEYGSQLVTASDAGAWLRAGADRLARSRGHGAEAHREPLDGIPLAFPNRVTLTFEDGSSDSELVDLPVGSFCHPDMVRHVERKMKRETTPTIGPQRAQALWSVGLALGAPDAQQLESLTNLARCR